MGLSFENLDDRTRKLMLEELGVDLENNNLYFSKRFSDYGIKEYPAILRTAILEGNDVTLGINLRQSGCIKETEERRKPNGGVSIVKVPVNAHETLAEGEFNRFYIRALCRRVIDDDIDQLEAYRAKQVSNARRESEQKIGQIVDHNKLLEDLRTNVGVDTALGLPAGPNSGLSVRIKQ